MQEMRKIFSPVELRVSRKVRVSTEEVQREASMVAMRRSQRSKEELAKTPWRWSCVRKNSAQHRKKHQKARTVFVVGTASQACSTMQLATKTSAGEPAALDRARAPTRDRRVGLVRSRCGLIQNGC